MKEEALFLQSLLTEFLGVSWLERVDQLFYVQNTFVEDMFPFRSYWYSSYCCALNITTMSFIGGKCKICAEFVAFWSYVIFGNIIQENCFLGARNR